LILDNHLISKISNEIINKWMRILDGNFIDYKKIANNDVSQQDSKDK
jgi:hypothetical protein